MKTNYIIKGIFTLLFTAFLSHQSSAQIRIVKVDPAADSVTIKNYDSSTQDIGSYRLCSLFGYRTLSSQTTVLNGSLNLAPNAEVTVSASGFLNVTAADLGLYLPTGSFGSSASMVDFTQWGSGGNGRESVAVTKGIWTAGTFVSASPPYAYTGSGAENGFQFWDTALSIDDFKNSLGLSIYPNPVISRLNIEFNTSIISLDFQVFDVLGKQVIKGNTSSEKNLLKIDVSSLEQGLYLIKISSEEKNVTKRFIKN